MIGVCRLVVAVLVALSGIAPAVTTAEERLVPLIPQGGIPQGKSQRCVEETGFMRRNHMELLKHQRDQTMYKGIRTTRHSLRECVSCHAVLGSDGRPVTIASSEHFCNSCHTYAAVTPDCFMCHASTPGLQEHLPSGSGN